MNLAWPLEMLEEDWHAVRNTHALLETTIVSLRWLQTHAGWISLEVLIMQFGDNFMLLNRSYYYENWDLDYSIYYSTSTYKNCSHLARPTITTIFLIPSLYISSSTKYLSNSGKLTNVSTSTINFGQTNSSPDEAYLARPNLIKFHTTWLLSMLTIKVPFLLNHFYQEPDWLGLISKLKRCTWC